MTFFESKPRCQNVTKLAIYIKPYFNTLQLLMLENPTGKSYLINGISDMTFFYLVKMEHLYFYYNFFLAFKRVKGQNLITLNIYCIL